MRIFSERVLAVGLAFASLLITIDPSFAHQETKEGPEPPSPPAYLREAGDLLDKGRYFDAVALLRAHSAADPGARQLLHQVEPFITGVPSSGGGKSAATPDPEVLANFNRAVPRPAIEAIVDRARQTSIVILNEAHDYPRHRAFALEVARALRPLGYSILALEALANDPDPRKSAAAMETIAKRGHVLLEDGHYTKDPVFADFIRQSLALGYRLLAYEHVPDLGTPAEMMAAREEGQARNLVERVFKNAGEAKLLIFVGYAHAAEAPLISNGESMEWMAARLKRMTGIDPLTIDQTTITEIPPRAADRAYYDAVSGKIYGSAILMLGGRPLVAGMFRDAVDLQVIHPPLRLEDGRPHWLGPMGRSTRPIPDHLRPASGRRLIQAFIAGEGEGAVPVDQVVAEGGGPAPPLMLPDMPIRYAVQQ